MINRALRRGQISPYQLQLLKLNKDSTYFRSRAIAAGCWTVISGTYVANLLFGWLVILLRLPHQQSVVVLQTLLAATFAGLCWMTFARSIPRAFRKRKELVERLRFHIVEGGVLQRSVLMDDIRAERDARADDGGLAGVLAQSIRKSSTPQHLLLRLLNFAWEEVSAHAEFEGMASDSASAAVLRSALQQAICEEFGPARPQEFTYPPR